MPDAMPLEQAVREYQSKTVRAVRLAKAGEPQRAVNLLTPLAESFLAHAPTERESGPKTFQTALETQLYMFLCQKDAPPPDCGGAHVNALFQVLGSAYLDLRDPVRAAESLSHALDYNPMSAPAIFEFTECFKAARAWDAHGLWCRNAFAMACDGNQLARAYRNMGYNLIERGELADAHALYRLSLRYAPSETAEYELAYIADKSPGKPRVPDEARMRAACKAHDVPFGPSSAVRGLLRGTCITFIRAGRPDLALPYLDQLKTLHPGQPLADVLARTADGSAERDLPPEDRAEMRRIMAELDRYRKEH